MGLGQTFDVIVVADAVPLTNGFWAFHAWIDYDDQGLVHKGDAQVVWPDCVSQFGSEDVPNHTVFVGCENVQVRPVPSFYKGELLSIALTCTENASSSDIQLSPFGDLIARTKGAFFLELDTIQPIVPELTGITVDCVPPLPIGGIAVGSELRALPLDVSQPSDPGVGVLAGVATALGFGAIVVGSARLYARRRGRV